MDLIMDEKISSGDSPLVLTSLSGQTTPQAIVSQMMASAMPSVQPSFTSGVPTLLTPSQISSLNISPVQQSANSTSKYAQLLQVIEELGLKSLFCHLFKD